MSEEALAPNVVDKVDTQAAAVEPVVPTVPEVTAVELSPEPIVEPKSRSPKKSATVAKPAPVAVAPKVAAVAKAVKPVAKAPAKAKAAAKPSAVVPKVKPVVAKPIAAKAPKKMISAKSAPIKPIAKAAPSARSNPFSETFTMTTTEITAAIKSALTEAQEKAKAAYEKGTASLSEGTEFAKGNVEAVVESSKILAEGLQKLGNEFVAESRVAFDTLTAEAKDLAAVKTPTDFFKLQSDLMRKHFDSAVAYGSKQTEAMVKLSTESMAPISRRVTLAMEAIKKAA